jgi:hypothetical protein
LRVYKRLKTYIGCIVYFKKEKYGELWGGGGGAQLTQIVQHAFAGKAHVICCLALVPDVTMQFDLYP